MSGDAPRNPARQRRRYGAEPFLRVAKDRLGHDIAHGDTSTAEGRRICRNLGTIPLNIWLNKYAGPRAGKGMRIGLRDGRIITLDRALRAKW